MVDDLLVNGIEPHVTLYHWDLPSALPGGWQTRDTANAFADYAGYVAGQLSDRVRHFMTLNEITSFIELGYGAGQHAPGLRLPRAQLNQARHHALLAHGLGVQAIRAHGRAGTQVGLAENPASIIPAIETPEHIAAAKRAYRAFNGPRLVTIMDGAYPTEFLQSEGAAAPMVAAGDMVAIGSRLDFVGLNIYTGLYAQAAPTPTGYQLLPGGASFPNMGLPWLRVTPEAIYWGIRLLAELWHPAAIYISENGSVAADHPSQGHVADTERVMYLRANLSQGQRATSDGYPLAGYFLWSLLDNFEWGEGLAARFGIHYVDFSTEQRTPKLSAAWYREVIARNALV